MVKKCMKEGLKNWNRWCATIHKKIIIMWSEVRNGDKSMCVLHMSDMWPIY